MHLTTLSPPAFVGDVALIWLLWVGTSEWPVEQAAFAIRALLVWMLFSKFIKLVTHFVRYPVDILLWPVSILFGWFHGIIKVYAMVTLNEVCAPFSTSALSSNRSVPRSLKHFVQRYFGPAVVVSFPLAQAFYGRGTCFLAGIQTDLLLIADNLGQPRRSGC